MLRETIKTHFCDGCQVRCEDLKSHPTCPCCGADWRLTTFQETRRNYQNNLMSATVRNSALLEVIRRQGGGNET